MSNQRKSPLGTIITVIIVAGLSLMPSAVKSCSRHSGNQSSASYSNTTREDSNDYRGYQIRFADDFKEGLATQDDFGLSVMIAVDCSGSMDEYPSESTGGDQKKYVTASQSLAEIIQFMEDLYNKSLKKENQILKIGLLRFSDSVETVYDLTAMTSAEFTRLKELASNSSTFEPTGSTAIGRTLEVGTEKLMQSGTIFKSLIVISDGVNTSGVDPEKVMEAIVNNRNNKSTPDLVISTISVLVSFIGFDISANYFSSLEQMGARVTSASNKEELIQSLKNIFIADITKLEAK